MTVPALQKQTILIVDDEPTNITVLAQALSSEYWVKIAKTGAKALEIACSEEQPDLILLDIMMPDMNGYEVCAELKASTYTRNIPFVFITARDGTQDEAEGLSMGAADYIAKPFVLPIVKARVKTLLKLKRQSDELKEMHKVALYKQEVFRAVADFAGELICYEDVDGQAIYISPCCLQLTGFSQNYFYQKPRFLSTLVHPDDCAAWQAYQQNMYDGLPQAPLEIRLLRRNQQEIWAQYSTSAVTNEAGEITGYRSSCIDISERKRFIYELKTAKEAAEAANYAKSRFLANMSHELRTPLNAIIGYSEILHEEAEEMGLEEFTEDAEKIHSSGKHLLSLINGVLDLSKIEAGKMGLYTVRFRPGRVIDDVLDTVSALLSSSQNALEIEYEEAKLGEMHTDMVKLQQILFNLLNNAIKFTTCATVRLKAWREVDLENHDWVIFQIRDEGIGMIPETMKGLFQPFTQADYSSTRAYDGAGLGLTISHHFISMMGGQMEVESEYGKGSCFTVRLPAVLTEHEPAAAAEDDAGEE